VVKQGEPKDEGDPKRQDKADTIDDLLGALKELKEGNLTAEQVQIARQKIARWIFKQGIRVDKNR
jgi:hypothetical protein